MSNLDDEITIGTPLGPWVGHLAQGVTVRDVIDTVADAMRLDRRDVLELAHDGVVLNMDDIAGWGRVGDFDIIATGTSV